VLALKVATLAMGDYISDVANKNSVAIATLANEIFTYSKKPLLNCKPVTNSNNTAPSIGTIAGRGLYSKA
jgi:hypothetical protein